MHYLLFLTLNNALSSMRVLVLTRPCGICTVPLWPLEGVTDSKVHPLLSAVQDSSASDMHRHNIQCKFTVKMWKHKPKKHSLDEWPIFFLWFHHPASFNKCVKRCIWATNLSDWLLNILCSLFTLKERDRDSVREMQIKCWLEHHENAAWQSWLCD